MSDKQLTGNNYQIIRNRLNQSVKNLLSDLSSLDAKRQDVFGTYKMNLIGNERVSTQSNTIAWDILALSQNKEISFFEKNIEIFKVKTVEIQNIVVNLENKFFPTHFIIEFKNGKIYQFDSEFPYVWKNELLK